MKCDNCNHSIKRSYIWNNQTLGIECWKKIALPEIERIRVEKYAVWQKAEYQKSFATVEALRLKDLSKIKSGFKIEFIKSVIAQFEAKGFLSLRQKEIIHGTGEWTGYGYDYGLLNKRDQLNEIVALYNISDEATKNWCVYRVNTFHNTPKEKAYFTEAIGGDIAFDDAKYQ